MFVWLWLFVICWLLCICCMFSPTCYECIQHKHRCLIWQNWAAKNELPSCVKKNIEKPLWSPLHSMARLYELCVVCMFVWLWLFVCLLLFICMFSPTCLARSKGAGASADTLLAHDTMERARRHGARRCDDTTWSWHGNIQLNTLRSRTTRQSMVESLEYSTAKYSLVTAWCELDTILCDSTMRYDAMRCDAMRCDTIRYDTMIYDLQ